MKSKNRGTGDIGEEIACGYLVENGYKIIGRNVMEKFGEIDIIAKSPDKTLVFIEVKTIKSPASEQQKSPASYPQKSGNVAGLTREGLDPEDNMTQAKIAKFKRVAQWYANKNQNLASNGYRLDVVTININGNMCSARHYKNII